MNTVSYDDACRNALTPFSTRYLDTGHSKSQKCSDYKYLRNTKHLITLTGGSGTILIELEANKK